jgi:GH43 family beta-xylosidase
MKKILLVLMVVAASFVANAVDFVLAQGKTARAVISIPKDAGESVKYAADELAKYLGMMSGAKFKVVPGASSTGARICVGDAYDGKPDEICVKVANANTLVVTGEGTRGPLYAVYQLLEHLGCGFWTPKRETVPELKEIKVAGTFSIVHVPDIEVRQSAGACAWENPEWEAKLGLNGAAYSGGLSAKLGGARQYDLSQCKMGLEGDDRLMGVHPEWYALRGGKRSSQHLCNTNPGVREEIVRRVKERLEKHPDLNQIALGLNDGADYCQCAACSKMRKDEGGQSALELDLCNYVARQFAKSNPKVRFLMFAYEGSLRPPKKMKCEPNVDVCLAFIQRNYARDPAAGTKNHNEILGAWSKLTGNNVYVWGYNAQFKDFQIPWPNVDTLGGEMRTYRDFKVKGVFMQMADDPSSDFQALRCWLAAKMMWDASGDEMKLIEAWCKGACGKGGKNVFAWLKECKRVREAQKWMGVYEGDTRGKFSAADLLKGEQLLSAAEAAVKDDETALFEVKRIHDSIVHAMLVRYYYDVAGAAKKAGVKIGTREDLLKRLCETRRGSWCEGVGWDSGFLPRIRHGEVQPEKPGDGPQARGKWTFRNPLTTGTVEDPCVVYDVATKYYYRVMTVGNEFRMRRAKKMVQLFDERCEEKSVWKAIGQGGIATNLRGPELIRGADGKWRIWACGGEEALVLEGESAEDVAVNRMFILEGGKDAFGGTYRFVGTVCEKENAADPTVVKMPNGKWYLFYSRESGRMGIVAREMVSATKAATAEGVILPAREALDVGNSPCVVKMGEDVYLLYGKGGRASAESEVRAMKYKSGNPTLASSWERCEKAVILPGNAFRNENTILAGPRAPAVFRSADGSEAWILFRGWMRNRPIDEVKDSIMCAQRLDDGLDRNTLLFGTGAELRILLVQPAGDFDAFAANQASKKGTK